MRPESGSPTQRGPPTLIGVTSGTTQASVPISAASPTSEEMSDGIAVLVGEISEAFAGDRWAILNLATDQVKWRLYDGAALRPCCAQGDVLACP